MSWPLDGGRPPWLLLPDDVGRVLTDPADTGRFHMVTGVREHDGRLWLGSLHEDAVAVLDVP